MSKDDDFGAPHRVGMLVRDEDGMDLVAFYEGDTWWQGHPGPGSFRVQVEKPVVALSSIPKTAIERVDDWATRLLSVIAEMDEASVLDLDGEGDDIAFVAHQVRTASVHMDELHKRLVAENG